VLKTVETDTVIRAALLQCRDQFQFYANEHFNAGKLEKAATNQKFADMADRALGYPPSTSIIATGDTVTLAEAEDGEILPGGDYLVAEVMRNGEAFTVVDHPRVLVHLQRVNAVARRD